MHRPERRLLAAGTAVTALLVVGAQSGGQTYAALSDFDSVTTQVGAGMWAPDPPAECGDLSIYGTPPLRLDAVIWGTPGDDVLMASPDGNHPQIIMGLDGNDTIHGGNSGDCLVGGPGNDTLVGGNAKDILLGGAGNDYLDGGNAKDVLDGEDDEDECIGGNGRDDLVNCGPLETTSIETFGDESFDGDSGTPTPEAPPPSEGTPPEDEGTSGGDAPSPDEPAVEEPVTEEAPAEEAPPVTEECTEGCEATP